jgi:hypothetical protein
MPKQELLSLTQYFFDSLLRRKKDMKWSHDKSLWGDTLPPRWKPRLANADICKPCEDAKSLNRQYAREY